MPIGHQIKLKPFELNDPVLSNNVLVFIGKRGASMSSGLSYFHQPEKPLGYLAPNEVIQYEDNLPTNLLNVKDEEKSSPQDSPSSSYSDDDDEPPPLDESLFRTLEEPVRGHPSPEDGQLPLDTRIRQVTVEDMACLICTEVKPLFAPLICTTSHQSCRDCLTKWLDEHGCCPYCRQKFPSSGLYLGA